MLNVKNDFAKEHNVYKKYWQQNDLHGLEDYP